MRGTNIHARGNIRSLRLTYSPRLRPRPYLRHPLRELSPSFRLSVADSYLRQRLSLVRCLSFRLQARVLDETRPMGLSNTMAVSALAGRRRSPIR